MEVVRKPVHIKRRAITYLTDSGYKKEGNRFVFANPNKPSTVEAVTRKLDKRRTLFCCYCAEETLFESLPDDRYIWKCAQCGITSSDYWVKHTNNMWFENCPFDEVKKWSNVRWC